jgi:multidrug resistance efflux pump
VASTPLTAAFPSSTPLRSLEAYVLAHTVDVSAGTHGVLKSVVVEPNDVVGCGQTVAVLEPVTRRGQTHDHGLAVKAPVAGLVIRWWAAPGESLGDDQPILTIARSEKVLVIARFPPGNLTRVRRGALATVRVGGDDGKDISATIISAVEAPDADAVADASGGRSTRVVLSIPEGPPEALWPGTPAYVRIDPERRDRRGA